MVSAGLVVAGRGTAMGCMNISSPLRTRSKVVTSMEIPACGQTWNGLMFYEQVGKSSSLAAAVWAPAATLYIWQRRTCGGRSDLRLHQGTSDQAHHTRVSNALLAFDVVEQDRIEADSVKLTGGSFAFIAQGPQRTRVELATSYRPKLGPRWMWRPLEELAVHTMHRYVLEGMKEQAVEAH